jgi:antitoxin (DNA-binding transcriptional repressor) of toxin-antitoxin stability system
MREPGWFDLPAFSHPSAKLAGNQTKSIFGRCKSICTKPRRISLVMSRAVAGEEIVVAKNGRPLVRLTAVSAPEGKRTPGLSMGSAVISDDFDDALPGDVQVALER